MKKRYTGRRVKLDARWPQLPQFRDVPGQIMAINYSGHALVQFEGADSGWHESSSANLQPLDRRDAGNRAAADLTPFPTSCD